MLVVVVMVCVTMQWDSKENTTIEITELFKGLKSIKNL
jgi:hypothetical protein